MKNIRICSGIVAGVMLTFALGASAGTIDPDSADFRYGWGENVGWIDFAPQFGPGVTVSDSSVTGSAWSENAGWIVLDPLFGGVANDGNGNLSGYAWGENVGWIRFDPPDGGVSIDACGDFNGYAWGENVGWIAFRSDDPNPFRVRSSWVSPLDAVSPVTAYTPAQQPWFNADTNVSLHATDCGTGVKEIRYQVDSGPETVVNGSTADILLVGEGCTSIRFHALDNANNSEIEREFPFCIDRSRPVITITEPPVNAKYNVHATVTPVYSVSDVLSGISSTTADMITTSQEGEYQFTVTATDKAGNTATVTRAYSVASGNVDPDAGGCRYAWGENVGWVNFKPDWGPGVSVSATAVTGMAWGENVGWIIFDVANGGVTNDGLGNLSGYAWGENIGWIDFNPAYGGVRVLTDGSFSGYAWGENVGWLSFDGPGFCMKSRWVAPPATCGSAGNHPTATAPTTNLCSVGLESAVTGSGPWTWTCQARNGGSDAACSAPVLTYPVTVTLAGTGGGTVTSTPLGITCTRDSCTSSFAYGTIVALSEMPDAVSTFAGWSGDCSASGTCSFMLAQRKTVIASFTLAPKAKIGEVGYASLSAAYAAAAATATILAIDSELPDAGLVLDQGKLITLKGGYKADYRIKTGLPTQLKGPLKIVNGALIAEALVVK